MTNPFWRQLARRILSEVLSRTSIDGKILPHGTQGEEQLSAALSATKATAELLGGARVREQERNMFKKHRLGAVAIPRSEYLRRLREVLDCPVTFVGIVLRDRRRGAVLVVDKALTFV